MDRYKKYMDDITVPDELHERFREPKKVRRKLPSRVWAGAAAACVVLGLVLLPGTGSGEKSTSSAQTTAAGADREWAAGGFDEEGTERIADDEWTEAGAARPESAEAGAGLAGEAPAETGVSGKMTSEGCSEAEDLAKYLPEISAEDFSGWELGEAEGEVLLEAEGSWDNGKKRIAVSVRRWEGEKEDGLADLGREAWERLLREGVVSETDGIRVTFTEDGYRVSYIMEGMTGEEAAEMLFPAW